MGSRLRGTTLWLTEAGWIRRLVTERRLGRRVAARFVAGDNLDAGMRVAGRLGESGIAAMLDHLGENVASPEQASRATDAYVLALKRIGEERGLDCNISVKLTQLGLDASSDLCMENVERVLQSADGPAGATLVMIDMEAREYVDRTLQVYLALLARYPNVGLAVQSYLRRSEEDVRAIAATAGPRAVVRMVKGAYLEPAEVAFQGREETRRQFAALSATLLAAGSTVHFATHDPRLVESARRFVRARGIPAGRYEFQMLYGIRRDLQRALVEQGEPVRVYVPYGTSWYPYLTRRLAERPANAWFFISNALRRGG